MGNAMKIFEIREKKAGLVTQMRGMVDKADQEKRELTADEAEQFDKLKTEVARLEQQEERAAFLTQYETAREPDDAFHQLEKRVTVMDAIRAQMGEPVSGALAEFNRETEKRTGKKAEGYYVPMSAFETRDTNTTTTAAGIVPPDFRASEFIAPLRKSLVMRALGIRTLTGLRGDVVIPKFKTGMTAAWVAEDSPLTESGMTFDNVTMKPKHVGALAQVSRQLIQQSSPDINALISDDIAYVMADALDKAILSGDGNLEPLGILNTPNIQTASLAALSWDALLKLAEKLDLANVENAQYLTNPTVMARLRATPREAGTGNYLATANMIADTKTTVSNQVPAKTLVLGDFSQFILGIWSEVDLLVNPYAESAYKRGNVMVRAMMTCGSVVRHPEAFVAVKDVKVA